MCVCVCIIYVCLVGNIMLVFSSTTFVVPCVCMCLYNIMMCLLNWKYYAGIFLNNISCSVFRVCVCVCMCVCVCVCMYVWVYNKICVCSVGSIMLMLVYVVFVYMCLLSSWKYYFSVLFSLYYTVVVGLGYKRYGLNKISCSVCVYVFAYVST